MEVAIVLIVEALKPDQKESIFFLEPNPRLKTLASSGRHSSKCPLLIQQHLTLAQPVNSDTAMPLSDASVCMSAQTDIAGSRLRPALLQNLLVLFTSHDPTQRHCTDGTASALPASGMAQMDVLYRPAEAKQKAVGQQ